MTNIRRLFTISKASSSSLFCVTSARRHSLSTRKTPNDKNGTSRIFSRTRADAECARTYWNRSFSSLSANQTIPTEKCHLSMPGKPTSRFYVSTESKRTSRIPKPLKWSYLAVQGNEPLLGMTMGQVMDRAGDLYGDREAVVSIHQGIRRTYAELQKDTSVVAAGLLAAGLKPGDRLGIWSPNSYEWVVVQFAAAKAGLVLVNINPSYRSGELEYCLKKVSVSGIVCASNFKTSNYYDMLCEVAPELPTCPPGRLKSVRLPHLTTVVMVTDVDMPGTFKFSELPDLATAEHREMLGAVEAKVQFDQPCNIQFTSGTTGLPKGAVLSHHNVVNNAQQVGDRIGYGKEVPRILVPVPLYHCFGCIGGSLTGALYGGAVVLPGAGFDGAASVGAVGAERITSIYGTPTMFIDMLAVARCLPGTLPLSLMGNDVTSADETPDTLQSRDNIADYGATLPLHTGIMAGAPCPSGLVTDLINEMGMRDFLVMYGMTETSPVSFQGFPDDPPKLRATTIGFPLPHTEVKVVDSDGNITRTGVEGELCVRAYSVFQGYWEDEAKTREILSPDRWLRTGDLAVLDEYGYCRISGRCKDVIIRGGENVYPAELEDFFRGHVRVLEAQVFGVPDPRMGEEVAVWLRLEKEAVLTEKEFKSWCRGKIAHYKIPRYVLVKTEFPTTVTGKIQKFKMREQTIEELRL